MEIKVVAQSDLESDSNDNYGYKTGKRYIATIHNGESLFWSFPSRTWNKTNESHSTVFEQLNKYFASLPQQQQAAIFEAYRDIYSVQRSNKRNSDTCEDLVSAITPLVTKLFACIDKDHLHNWVWSVLRPTIPVTSSAMVFDPTTMPGTRERTYLNPDYRDLIPLIIVLRMVCPFWFDFVELTAGTVSQDHRDMVPFGLLVDSWPMHSPAMHRLTEFIDHTVGKEKYNPAVILLGIGSNTFVYWILAAMVIVRIPVVDVMGTQSDKQVVSALYNFIGVRITTLRKSQPSVNNKFADSSFNADENNQSFLEGFRNRIELTVGQEADGDYYIERTLELIERNEREPLSLLERVAPGIDYALVRDALKSSKRLDINLITEQQINIAAWLFHPYSQARASNNFRGERILTLLGLAQAVLLHLGKFDLAIMVTAECSPIHIDDSVVVIGEAIASLRSADRDRYRATFPLEKTNRNKNNSENYVMTDVYAMVKAMQGYNITCTFSKNTLAKLPIVKTLIDRRYTLRSDSVTLLMDFAVYLAERPIVRIDPNAVYLQLIASKGIGLERPSF